MMRRLLGVCGVTLVVAMGASLAAPAAASAQAPVPAVTMGYANLRGGPGTQYAPLTTVPPAVTLFPDARSADSKWAHVSYNARVGWLFADLLRFYGDFSALPVAQPPASHPQNGAIDSLTLYVSTEGADYYRLVYWSDGLRINGFYAEPKGGGQHPAVIYNRGGNRDTGALTGVELAPFAETGFVVVASQLRGGAGSEGRDEFGGADVHDVSSLIALLKGRPGVDRNRIVMVGGSRGGMMTYLALKAQAQRGTRDIKAAAVVSGLADLFSWASERPDIANGVYLELIGTLPAQNAAPFIERSATYWPQLIRAPLLLQHGEADNVVSAQQSVNLYRLIKARGGVVSLITYPDGEHGLPWQLGGVPETLAWFQKYVGRPSDNFDFAAHADAIYGAQAALYDAR